MNYIDSSSPSAPNSDSKKLNLRQENASSELVISSGDEEEFEDETVLATSQSGSTLTLLEEYSLRKAKGKKRSLLLAILCAAVSISFAYLTYTKL